MAQVIRTLGELRALMDEAPNEVPIAVVYEGESFPVIEADLTTDPGQYAGNLIEQGDNPMLVLVVTD